MWILLRLFTALMVGLFRYFSRTILEGEIRRTGTIDWEYREHRNKKRVTATTFGVPFPHEVYVRFSREGGLDRFFKSTGFSCEVQTGDAAFDDALYVTADHLDVATVLKEDPTVRHALLELFGDENVQRVFSDGNNLCVYRSGEGEPSEATLARLASVRDGLNVVPAERLSLLHDRFFWRALVVEGIAWSVAGYGIPAVVELVARDHALYFEWWPVIFAGLGLSLLLFAALFGLARWVLRGSSRAHRVLVESAVVLAIGVPFSAIEIVSDLNRGLDRSAPVFIDAAVYQKETRVSTGRRGRKRTHYYLSVAMPEQAKFHVPGRLTVSAYTYESVHKGQNLRITMRDGALGLPWVEHLAAAP